MRELDMNISCMRIISTAAVVLLHTCSTISSNPNIFEISDSQENFLLVISKLLRFAVPLFFMMTGQLLFQKKRTFDYKTIFNKYIRRIILALLIFSIPFAIVKEYMEIKTISLISICKDFLCDESFSHLWYLYTLIAVYLILPVLGEAVQHTSRKSLFLFCVCIFGFDFVVPFISSFLNWDIAFSIAVTYPVLYFIMGYLVNTTSRSSQLCMIAYAAILFSMIVMIIVILLNGNVDAVCSYNSPIIAIYSIALYYLLHHLRHYKLSDMQMQKIWKIDRLCFGVYLIHPVFIQFTYRILKITPTSFSLYPIVTIFFFFVFLIVSFIASYIMNLIPVLRKYVL